MTRSVSYRVWRVTFALSLQQTLSRRRRVAAQLVVAAQQESVGGGDAVGGPRPPRPPRRHPSCGAGELGRSGRAIVRRAEVLYERRVPHAAAGLAAGRIAAFSLQHTYRISNYIKNENKMKYIFCHMKVAPSTWTCSPSWNGLILLQYNMSGICHYVIYCHLIYCSVSKPYAPICYNDCTINNKVNGNE